MEVGKVYERGDSRRVVKEINRHGDPRTEVIYSLYRRTQLALLGVEWWFLREGYCSFKTWKRWNGKEVTVGERE